MFDEDDIPAAEPLGKHHLRSLAFRQFRCLRHVDLELGSRLAVLVGANATGKSSVLDGVHLLSQMLEVRRGEADSPNGVAGLVFRGPRAIDKLVSHDASAEDGALPRSLVLGVANEAYSVWLNATCSPDGPVVQLGAGSAAVLRAPTPWPTDRGAKPRSGREMETFRARAKQTGFGGAVRLRLDARRASQPSYSEHETPRVESDGFGLASALSWLSSNEPAAREAIEADLASLVEGAGKLRVPRARIERWEEETIQIGGDALPRRTKRHVMGERLEVEFAGAGFLPIEQLSEGTILALTLLTTLHSPTCPHVVLLDDIDHALHPDAQFELIRCIRRLLNTKPELQILATTHSPYLLDTLHPDEVHVLARDAHGDTHSRRFSEHPKASKLLRSLHLSELWSGLGESWVLDSVDGTNP